YPSDYTLNRPRRRDAAAVNSGGANRGIIGVGSMKFLCSLLIAAGALAQQPAMRPFAIDWQNNSEALSDVSFLLDAPAGKAGFVGIRNGHLAYPNGRRFRIWGVNMTGSSNLPSREDAPKVAAHL